MDTVVREIYYLLLKLKKKYTTAVLTNENKENQDTKMKISKNFCSGTRIGCPLDKVVSFLLCMSIVMLILKYL